MNVPLGAELLLVSCRMIPESKDPNAHRADIVGGVLSVVTLTAILGAIIEGPVWGWANPLT